MFHHPNIRVSLLTGNHAFSWILPLIALIGTYATFTLVMKQPLNGTEYSYDTRDTRDANNSVQRFKRQL